MHHYSRGEDIYDWMLDKDHRQYSCAYFKDDKDSLETAQNNKIQHIIKKLNIKDISHPSPRLTSETLHQLLRTSNYLSRVMSAVTV